MYQKQWIWNWIQIKKCCLTRYNLRSFLNDWWTYSWGHWESSLISGRSGKTNSSLPCQENKIIFQTWVIFVFLWFYNNIFYLFLYRHIKNLSLWIKKTNWGNLILDLSLTLTFCSENVAMIKVVSIN